MLKLERHNQIINHLPFPGFTGFGVSDREPSSSGKLAPKSPLHNGKYNTFNQRNNYFECMFHTTKNISNILNNIH